MFRKRARLFRKCAPRARLFRKYALRARDLIWLYFSNFVVVALTIGLATPWAVVRSMRYRASKTTAIASGPLDGFAEGQAQQVSVAGEEVAELFDIDIAL